MSYLAFDLLLVGLPALLLLLGADRARRRALAVPAAALATVALVWTFPWDEHLVRTGVWSYGPERVLARVGSIPAEELLFVVLEVALVAAWATRRGLLPALDTVSLTVRPERVRRGSTRTRGALLWFGVGLIGGLLLLVGGHARYLGLLLVWAAPPMALQAAVAGVLLRGLRVTRLATAVPVVLWLCAADRLALADGIWSIAPASSTGLLLLGLPVEEAAFFCLTVWLVTDGLLLATSRVALSRATALLVGSRRAGRPQARHEREAGRCRSATPSSSSSATPPWSASTASRTASPPPCSPRSSTSTPVARSRTASRSG